MLNPYEYYIEPINYGKDLLDAGNYKAQIENNIERKNRADTYNMTTEDERERFRHILTSALFSKRYGTLAAELFGNMKEVPDMLESLIQDGNIDNSKIDLLNNEIGRDFYKLNSDLPEKAYYDLTFESFIRPERSLLNGGVEKNDYSPIRQGIVQELLNTKE